ncbi:MAG: hypothetical protein JO114_09080 [Planctomycetaceae bacterium]|nr:hypothetical protein [Planctomycetaceae bacterium]
MHGSITRNSVLIALTLVVVPNGLRAGGEDYRVEPGRVRRAELVRIAPGTLVGDQPPRMWSHLVIKSLPRLASGDLGTLPRSAFRTATLIHTVILADVGRSADDPSRFALHRVGIGLCIPDLSRGDVVVDSGRLGELGIKLGMMEKVVLQAAEEELALGRLIASGPTFALYRGPAVLQVGQLHHKVEISYAFLVDEQSGALRVLVWSAEARKGGPAAPARLVELRPNLVFDCPLNVKAERLLGTVPVSWSFAMESLPPGQPRPMSPDLRRYLGGNAQQRDPERMEHTLRRALTAR